MECHCFSTHYIVIPKAFFMRFAHSHITIASVLQVKEKEKEMRLLILGLDNAGKTTILRKFCGLCISNIEPTLGFHIQTLLHCGYTLNVWDIGGQKSIRAYWRNYFEQTDGLIWVVDSADRIRLEACRTALEELLQQDKLAGASLLIFANKQDIQGAMSSQEIASVLGLETNEAYKNRHWSIQSCSAVTGEGLVAGMDWVVNDIASRIFMLS
jgi:ADP-ribosylation factor-like protein 2